MKSNEKKSLTINKNEIEKIKRKIKIKTSNNVTRVIYLVMLNEFLYQNKFEIQKHIKFIKQLLLKKTMQGYTYEKSYKKTILKNN
jgi:hypothetical protein